MRGLSLLLGGPLGRHGRPALRRSAILVLVALIAAVVGTLSWAQKSPCRTNVWSSNFQYTHYCYTDIAGLYYDEHLNDLSVPYLDNQDPARPDGKYVEYPVLTGWYWFVAAEIAQWVEQPSAEERAAIASRDPARAANATAALQSRQSRAYFDVSVIGLVLMGIATVALVGAFVPRRPWDAAMVAVSPVFLLYLDMNWDVLAALSSVAALYAWTRKQPILAGVFLAVGVSAKLFPIVLLVAFGCDAMRSRRWRECLTAAASGAAAWLVINVPVWLLAPRGFGYFWSFNRNRVADFDTWAYAVEQFVLHHTMGTGTLNLIVAVLFAISVAAVVILARWAPTPPRVAQTAFLVAASFVLVNKVWSPQYAMFLLPLAVLARPRWSMFLLWQASELVLFLARDQFLINLGGGAAGIPYHMYFWVGVVPRAVTLMLLMGRVGYEIAHPEADIVRTDRARVPALVPAT